MEKQNKELLLKDICGRLPYDIKVLYNNKVYSIDYVSGIYEEIKLDNSNDNYTLNISNVKPYLFPLSSMTEEQQINLTKFVANGIHGENILYVRDYDMFISEVDHQKYPNITQKYRFEEIS